MWTVLLHPKVQRFLDKQDPSLRQRLEDGLRKLKEDPFRYLEPMQGEEAYKFRVGQYRALVEVEREKDVVKVQVLGHRRSIYKG